MAKDLKLMVDNIALNIRTGVIMRYNEEVVVEVSTVGRNSVIPGGRIQINESSKNALKREMQEEMNLNIDLNKLKQVKVFENFFDYDNTQVHEIFFVYEYNLTKTEADVINNLKNLDNATTYFKMLKHHELEKYNLLPLALCDIIRGTDEEKN